MTGVTSFANQLAGKRLGLLREIAPKAAVIAFLINAKNPNAAADTKDAQVAADALGRELRVLTASTESDLDAAFAAMVQLRAGALLINIDPFFFGRRQQLVTLAALCNSHDLR